MKLTACFTIFLLALSTISAQFIKEKAIDASIGLGISVPYDDTSAQATGFYAQGELVLTAAKWLDLRPYMGLILAKENGDDETGQKISAHALLLGGKARITAPIPWVAPYLEGGVGLSIGKFQTVTLLTNIEEKGAQFHIPFSLGLELGPKHLVDLAFTYYFHPSAEQFVGAMAIGVTIPLN
ncbi:MAG: hypothetical protein KDD31_05680 [Muricauda sp.]|nr:hypothetical protein [Allomuricauda sp.]